MQKLMIVLFTCMAFWGGYQIFRSFEAKSRVQPSEPAPTERLTGKVPPASRINLFTSEAEAYIKRQRLSSDYFFFMDMSLASHRERFYVYDFKKKMAVDSGLVTQGHCNSYAGEIKYSNNPGSACTSPGRFKIGNSYYGRFGLAYKLHGLDSTNSNAFIRYVVLHAHDCVPEQKVDYEICRSEGCPTVSPGFLKKLDKLLKKSQAPVLLWIKE